MGVLLLHGKYRYDEPLLLTAVQRGDLAMVKLLLGQDNVDPNAQSSSSKQTPLLYTVEQREHTHIVETLLRSGRVDANSKGGNSWTPLMMAVSHGIIPTVEALLKHPGTNVLTRDDDGKVAYTHAFY
ncbi:ankyrin repeat-containing domain protein, partial [Armillaria luteobubalina]